jgi:hypothetical protein
LLFNPEAPLLIAVQPTLEAPYCSTRKPRFVHAQPKSRISAQPGSRIAAHNPEAALKASGAAFN